MLSRPSSSLFLPSSNNMFAGNNQTVTGGNETVYTFGEVLHVLLPLVVAFGAAAFYIVTPMLLVCILFLPSGIIDAVNFGILQLALKISIFILKPSTIFFLLRSVLHLFGSSIRITFGLVRFLARLALKLAWCTVVLATVLSLIAVLLAAALALSEDRDALLETTYTGLGVFSPTKTFIPTKTLSEGVSFAKVRFSINYLHTYSNQRVAIQQNSSQMNYYAEKARR